MPVVKHSTVEEFQKQYGTLWNAATAYFDGSMTQEQAAGFELVVKAEFLAAVAQTRLLDELVATFKAFGAITAADIVAEGTKK